MTSSNPPITLAQHPPAVKVAGRRVSISKPKSHPTEPAADSTEQSGPEVAEEPADYPRPAPPPAEGQAQQDEPPKKEKKQGFGNHDKERKHKESAHRKFDANMPAKDMGPSKKDYGAGGRILQPVGKELGS